MIQIGDIILDFSDPLVLAGGRLPRRCCLSS
jgi:hypothetical protein